MPASATSASDYLRTNRQVDRLSLALVVACLAILYLPTLDTLAETVWIHVEQSYGPVLLAAAAWLIWQRLTSIDEPAQGVPALVPGYALLTTGLIAYAIGHSQGILFFEAGSMLPVVAALVLLTKGRAGLMAVGMPVLVLAFVVPLPPDVVAAVTAPLKSAVSTVAAWLMYEAGYPVARTGVILLVGQYQLLVADACAGLTSMFTLEAVGLVYLGLRRYPSTGRNVALGILLIPIAFMANVIRVLILSLVTYHFGDEAGQGLVHSFAGIVLFIVATMLMLLTDFLLGRVPAFHATDRQPA